MGFSLEQVRDDLRAYLRDSSGLNRILEDSTENSDDDLDRAIRFGLMNFNMVAPITSYTLDNAPNEIYYFIINEAAVQILISAGILHSRNRLNYSDGGITVADHDKAGPYQSWVQVLTTARNFFQQEKQYKLMKNLESCYSIGGSGFLSEFLSMTYDGWRIF